MADLDRLYETVGRAKGRIDIVVANAGVAEFVPFSRWENGKQPLDRRAVALVSALALEAQGSRAVALDLLEALATRKKPSKRVRLDVSAPG